MKTTSGTVKQIFSPSKPLLCESSNYLSFSLLSLPSSLSHARKRLFSLIALACQEARAGILAVLGSYSNSRIYLGLILLCVIAPLSTVAYHIFDKNVGSEWYYSNYYYLFYILCPHLCAIIISTSFFFIFPFSGRSYFLAIPIGSEVSKIIWLCTVTNNNELHQLILPTQFLITGFLIAIVWLFTFNYLMTLHFHKREGTIARIRGLISAPNIPDALRIELLKKEETKLGSLSN